MNTIIKITLMTALGVSGQSIRAATFTGTGANAAGISSALSAFRSVIGGVNNGANNPLGTVFDSGRREINWDAGALPVDMPPDFFNRSPAPGNPGSRRGAEFKTDGTGFQVSLNSAVDPNREFANLDPSYLTEFTFNSASRLFAAKGSAQLDTLFFLPNDPKRHAGVNAFGVVFTDVDLAAVSGIELYDDNNQLLGSAFAPVNDKGLSFVGIQLPQGQLATRVHVTAGNLALGLNQRDGGDSDAVAMDDFIYSEPSRVPDASDARSMILMAFGSLLCFRSMRRMTGEL